jgi:hypothetical protein
LLIHASAARAFTLMPSASNDGARWRGIPVVLKGNFANAPLAPDEMVAIVQDAFSLWGAVPTTSYRIQLVGETSTQAHDLAKATDGPNAIAFDNDFEKTFSSSDQSAIAVSTVLHQGDHYTRGVIVVNAAKAPLDRILLRAVITHEAGHVAGLGHSSDESAVMYPIARPVSQLSEDDVSGISYLYPRNEAGHGPFGCGTLSGRGSRRFPIFVAWVGAFFLGWAGIRLRASRA